MVKVQIPLDIPIDKAEVRDEEEDSVDSIDKVGIMSDSDVESEVDDEIGDPDWDEIKDREIDGPDSPVKLSSLPQNGVTIHFEPVKPLPRSQKAQRAQKVQKSRKARKAPRRDNKNKPVLPDKTKLDGELMEQDMPNSDKGFKNHPIYVLEKHLLKFQGIYPPEVPPMGFFKDQPVYPRDCVHTLRSRETWLREARTVRLYESPYKIVKARPKRDKYTGELIRDLPLELFGEWQTEPYEPPEAKDGKVPRNCYGNVDMYQECMLPKGCTWLKLPALLRIANKLGIDCAAAVVGFDNHRGSYGAHPVIDGFIVCTEHEETLRMAWEEEQENHKQREESKRQKRIWDNWKRLIKAAQIREKLRVKYKNS